MANIFIEKVTETKRRNIPFRFNKTEFYKFIVRLTNKEYADKITLKTITSSDGYDEYSIYDKDDKIVIEATSGVSAGVAFNAYLKTRCGVHFGLITDSGTLPKIPPKVNAVIKKKSLYLYRYFLNYCTFGYTFTYYSWKDWEKLIDRMILSGYNLVLNAVGQECVWKEVLLKLGYSKEQVDDFLAGAPFMPWLNMMNMSGYLGKYPDSWWENRVKLSNRITSRLSAFGVGVMLPGFSGMVPNDFDKRFKGSAVKDQGDWCGYDRPKYLLFNDKNFDYVADTFYQTQNQLLGKNKVHYYSSDPFHEGGVTDGINLAEFAKSAFSAMKRNDEKAVWCFQGWENNPRREMIGAIPFEDTLVCNLLADTNGNAGDNYLDRPWIYCTVNNFGGQHLLRGGLKNSLLKPYKFSKDDGYTMVGIGLMPESVENDEVFYDVTSYTAINGEEPSLDAFLKEFISARYGIVNDSLLKAWKILADKVYLRDDISVSFESSYLSLPSLTANKVSAFARVSEDKYPQDLLEVISLLLENYEECKNSSAFIFDLADISRQTSANYSWHLVYGMQSNYKNKQLKALKSKANLFLKLFALQDKICSCHKKLLFANYLNYAKKYDITESSYNTYLARRLITVWGDERTNYRLNDYAAREYGGLVKDYYMVRWKKFIQMMIDSLTNDAPLEEHDFYQDAENFTKQAKNYSLRVRTDLDKLVSKLISILRKGYYN